MTTSANSPVQVLTTPGGAQLVAALAAAGWRADEAPGAARRVLVINDLFSPDGRHGEFAEMIAGLARQAGRWLKIVDLSPEKIAYFRSRQRSDGPAAVRSELKELLGIAHCDELVMSHNHLRVHDLLSLTFPRARRVCYGDGIGLNFSAEYFHPATTVWDRWRGRLSERRRWLRCLLGRGGHWRPRKQAEYRVLLANRFDEQLENVNQLDPAIYRELFKRMGRVLQGGLGQRYEQIGRQLQNCSESIALLTSNFSEAGRMTLAEELTAYEEFLDAMEPSAGAGLILKPHPRDAAEKIELIRERLAGRFQHVEVLDDPVSFYLPFELALARMMGPEMASRLRVACFSSACLTLHYLYGVQCLVGFGEETVRKHFPAEHVETRLRVERDLRTLLWELPPSRQKRAA